jgi:hypothetical protein
VSADPTNEIEASIARRGTKSANHRLSTIVGEVKFWKRMRTRQYFPTVASISNVFELAASDEGPDSGWG